MFVQSLSGKPKRPEWLCCPMPVRVGGDAQMNVAISSSGFFSIACSGMVASSFG